MQRPSFQLYPREWLADPELQSASGEAIGLWINACCVMHDCKPYGHLSINNQPMTDAQAASATKFHIKTYKKRMRELIRLGIAKQNSDGFVYSARMINDQTAREYAAQCGSLSLRNPNVPRPKQLRSEGDIPRDIPPGEPSKPSSASAVAFIYNKGSMLGQSAPTESKSNSTSTPADIQPDSQKQGNGEGYSPPAPPISSVPPAPRATLWLDTPEGVARKGKAIDLPAEPGETFEHYRTRIMERLRQLRGDH
jgi:hypothetical protein